MENEHYASICDKTLDLLLPRFCRHLQTRGELATTIYGISLAMAIAAPALILVLLHYILFDRNVVHVLHDPSFLICIPYVIGWALSTFAVSRALLLLPRLLRDVEEVVRATNISLGKPIHVRFVQRVVHENKLLTTLIFLLITTSAYAWFFNHYLRNYFEALVMRPLVFTSVIYTSTLVFLRTSLWTSRVATYILGGLVELRSMVKDLTNRVLELISKPDPGDGARNIYAIYECVAMVSVPFKRITDFAVWGSFMWTVGLTLIIPMVCFALGEPVPLLYGLLTAVVFYALGILFYVIPKRAFNLFVKSVKKKLVNVIEEFEKCALKELTARETLDESLARLIRSYIVLDHVKRRISAMMPDMKPSLNKYYIMIRIPLPIISVALSQVVREAFTQGSTGTLLEALLKVLRELLMMFLQATYLVNY